jgi:4-diphosphocytidyl-2-C-methyl-D-erythritol kinase
LVIVEKAPAKINLALHVLGRRVDGYHELSSIVAFADVGDVLEISPAAHNSLVVDGPFAAHLPLGDSNIIWKAWGVLNALMPLPFVSVRLTKNLPVASGIGGGSADAAAMLRGMLQLVDKDLSDAKVAGFARSIGADVPVCFYGTACKMEGIGETISALTDFALPNLVLVNPLVSCSTRDVFNAMAMRPREHIEKIRDQRSNDMTEAAIKVQPIIANVLQALKATQLSHARMSGSGATCFAEARSFTQALDEAEKLQRLHPTWWVKAAHLS